MNSIKHFFKSVAFFIACFWSRVTCEERSIQSDHDEYGLPKVPKKKAVSKVKKAKAKSKAKRKKES